MLVHDLVSDMHTFSSMIYFPFGSESSCFRMTAMTAFEHDGVAQLTVVVSVPSQTCEVEQCFSVLVNTLDRTATGVW